MEFARSNHEKPRTPKQVCIMHRYVDDRYSEEEDGSLGSIRTCGHMQLHLFLVCKLRVFFCVHSCHVFDVNFVPDMTCCPIKWWESGGCMKGHGREEKCTTHPQDETDRDCARADLLCSWIGRESLSTPAETPGDETRYPLLAHMISCSITLPHQRFTISLPRRIKVNTPPSPP